MFGKRPDLGEGVRIERGWRIEPTLDTGVAVVITVGILVADGGGSTV